MLKRWVMTASSLTFGSGKPRRVMTVLEAEHALGEMGERIEHAAEHDIKDGEDERVEREPNDGERGEIVPGLGDLIGRLADDDDRVRMLDGNHPHRAADELWPDQAGEPGRHYSSLAPRCSAVAATRR